MRGGAGGVWKPGVGGMREPQHFSLSMALAAKREILCNFQVNYSAHVAESHGHL